MYKINLQFFGVAIFCLTSVGVNMESFSSCNSLDLRAIVVHMQQTQAEYKKLQDMHKMDIANLRQELNDSASISSNKVETIENQMDALQRQIKELKTEQENQLSLIGKLQEDNAVLREQLNKSENDRICCNCDCPNNWTKYDSSCYLYSSNLLTFDEAEDFCEELGGHLVHVNNYCENIFVKSYLKDMNAGSTWMGLTDIESENVWIWYGTKSPPSYTNWAPLEPDNYNLTQDCVLFWDKYQYAWDDETCSIKVHALCEIEN